MMKKILSTFLYVWLVGCGGSGQTIKNYNQEVYHNSKSEFPQKLTDHFPKDLECDSASTQSLNDPRNNNIRFLLYELGIEASKIDSIKKYCLVKSIAQYQASDTCLMIVNRFESANSLEKPIVTDSTLINRNCYKSLYPIPHFIENPMGDVNTDTKLDSSFSIYVLKAQPGKHFKEYEVFPFEQMPPKWQNGYSKGIAVSEKKRIVIYWAITW